MSRDMNRYFPDISRTPRGIVDWRMLLEGSDGSRPRIGYINNVFWRTSVQNVSMPGRLFLTQDTTSIAEHFQVPPPDFRDPPRLNISPGQEIIVMRQDRQLCRMRWGIIPVGRVNARGRPVMETIINARSDSVFEKSAFEGVQRCIVPAEGWYEWTGEKRKKTAWRILPRSGGLLAFAAICDVWTAPGGLIVPQVAILTCPPSDDVKDIHDRMGVILKLECVGIWLDGSQDGAVELMLPLALGQLTVELAENVDWTAP